MDQNIPANPAEMAKLRTSEPNVPRLAECEAPSGQDPTTKKFSGLRAQLLPVEVAQARIGKGAVPALEFLDALLAQQTADPGLTTCSHHAEVVDWCMALCHHGDSGGGQASSP